MASFNLVEVKEVDGHISDNFDLLLLNMKIFYIYNNKLCCDLNSLYVYVRDSTYGSEIYTDILEYALYGDLSKWLLEHGYNDIANQVDAIDKTIGRTEFVNKLTKLLLNEVPVITKPNYSNCFSCNISSQSLTRY